MLDLFLVKNNTNLGPKVIEEDICNSSVGSSGVESQVGFWSLLAAHSS